MSSAANHRRRSHRSYSKHYAAGRKMMAGAVTRETGKLGPFGRILARFRKRESRAPAPLEGGQDE